MNKIPGDVYYRCVWLVRDSKRLAELASVEDYYSDSDLYVETGFNSDSEPEDYSEDFGAAAIVDERVIRRAENELRCIGKALSVIPEAYRHEILANIRDRQPFSDFAHPNTWKKWKHAFIYELARELHLI